ncbi:hypothetical protein KCP69_07710 [Salmonella enterica subsp. enterica]|nr:hypothetical protein KCP69_07710 [Salmonella enterica subsp. enterica]
MARFVLLNSFPPAVSTSTGAWAVHAWVILYPDDYRRRERDGFGHIAAARSNTRFPAEP